MYKLQPQICIVYNLWTVLFCCSTTTFSLEKILHHTVVWLHPRAFKINSTCNWFLIILLMHSKELKYANCKSVCGINSTTAHMWMCHVLMLHHVLILWSWCSKMIFWPATIFALSSCIYLYLNGLELPSQYSNC